MSPEERDRLTRVEASAETLREDMTELKADVKSILATLNQAKGGWKTLMAVGTVGGALGSIATWAISHIPFVK